MSMVDNAKEAKNRIVEWLHPQRVVFHHVPKCGGTSVGRALRKRYLLSQDTVLPEESFRAFEAFSGRSDRERMLVDVLSFREQILLYLMFRDIRCLSLHVPFSDTAHRLFAGKYKFVTILREPVSRFISHYFWSRGRPHAHGKIEQGFSDFLETERARRLGASYVEYYCGLGPDADLRSESTIQAAIRNLGKFSVVGSLDDLPAFEMALRRELGVSVRVRQENRSRESEFEKRDVVTPELRQRAAELCGPDLAVWNAFKAGDVGAAPRMEPYATP